jgi:hypothetical protein
MSERAAGGPTAGDAVRLSDLPVVFMSYDEPWADDTWAALQSLRPDAHRVQGVKGLNACHVAAAEAAGTDWFLTVDADTILAPGFFDVTVPGFLLQPVFRLDWLSRNALNGLVSGNGCLKLWPRALVMAMRSHEAAPRGQVSLDADIGRIWPGKSRQVLMPGCYSTTDPARTPFHAFRAGFREAAFLAQLYASATSRNSSGPFADTVARTLHVWCSIGAHAPNGLWALYGARLGARMRLGWSGWNVTDVNDYERLARMWQAEILPRIGPGGSRCALTGVTWDAGRLAEECAALAAPIGAASDIVLADFDAEESRLVAECGLFPTGRFGAGLDALGWAFAKGLGVPVDISAARDFFEIAVLMGHPAAMANMGNLHAAGLIPDADPARAETYFRAATALGDPHAPYHLARMLQAEGADPGRDDEAERLLDLAAERGFAPDAGGSAA